jgi:Holliday junction resolvase RusA-like endonuclease
VTARAAAENAAQRPTAADSGAQRLVLDPLDPKLVQRLSANGRSQSHWPRTNARNDVMARVIYQALYQQLPKFATPVTVLFRWVVPTRGRRDLDNLASNGIVKATLDSLVEGKWLPDDSSQWVREVRTEMVYERGRRALEVEIEPASNEQ